MKIASIILCAGAGSRLKSDKAKVLHEVGGKAMGYWPIKNALLVTNMKPIVVCGFQSDKVKETLTKYFGDSISFVHQPILNGTAGAVKAALPLLAKDCQSVLVLCGDSPLLRKESLEKLITIQTSSHVAIAMLSALALDPHGYGRIIRNSAEHISKIVECRHANAFEKEIKEVNPSVYVFDAQFLRENIDNITNNNNQHEFYLTDLVQLYINNQHKDPIGHIEIPYEEMHGINDRKQLAFAEKIFNQRILDKWMLDGVTIIDPNTTIIEDSVILHKDSVIYPSVHLQGESEIGKGVIIENGCIIKDTIIKDNAHILPYTYADKAFIGEHSLVGPFARLRPKTLLMPNVKVGNFVELKNSTLKSGVKIGHVSYIGDSEVGKNTNIGAGAIICNYDGINKHHTTIGDNTFIGANTTLISPLNLGDESYIAAASVITEDVPKKTLAIARAKQVHKARKKV